LKEVKCWIVAKMVLHKAASTAAWLLIHRASAFGPPCGRFSIQVSLGKCSCHVLNETCDTGDVRGAAVDLMHQQLKKISLRGKMGAGKLALFDLFFIVS